MQKSKGDTYSRSQILAWINKTLNINETRIENLGSGVIYCLMLNHYYPGAIPLSKITMIPRSVNDYRANLRRFQEGLSAQDIRSIAFDVFKVSEMAYAENWNLICKLHKHLNIEKDKNIENYKERLDVKWTSKIFDSKPEISPSFYQHAPIVNPGLCTPIKDSKFLEEGKSRWQSMSLIEQIKKIVSTQGNPDRVKVGQLRKLLGMQNEEEVQSQPELGDLLSDYKKKQEVIQIADD